MEKIDLLSIDFDSDAERIVYRVADDELGAMYDYRPYFFFGKLVNENPFVESEIDEKKYYAYCTVCGKLIEQKKKPKDGTPYQCPLCSTPGVLYDFRNPKSCVNDHILWLYGILEIMDKGYCLRLFNVTLDFDGRDFDDYTTLDAYPGLVIDEVGREYWYEGRVEYYSRKCELHEFTKVDRIEDREYYIIGYENPYDPYSSALIDDILCDNPMYKTFIETISKKTTYRTFNALRKYGFDSLFVDLLYCPHVFGDSKKISEVLLLDYNQVLACGKPADIDLEDLLAMRELKQYGLSFSRKNVDIMRVFSNKLPHLSSLGLNKDNIRKTFKYLRNQMSRRKVSDGVATDYCDYLFECRKLGLNTDSPDIRYPTDLKTAHERTSALIRYESNKEMEDKLRIVYERFHEYCEFSDGVYCIVMPSCSEDIIREGKIQNHCVGGYAERMANGEDIILFIRKVNEPDKPFYTMEIRPTMKKLDLVQCRGYKNEDESKEIRDSVDEFLSCYTSWFNKRKCNESETMLRKYYKAVQKCEDGRYISFWDNKTEYKIGEVIEAKTEPDPDRVAVPGIHIASLEFARNYGKGRDNPAILEIEVDLRDVVVPNAKDQLRTKRGRVLREVI